MYIELFERCPESRCQRQSGRASEAYYALYDVINSMSHVERRELVHGLSVIGYDKLLPNLTYDYDKQVWI